MEDGSPCSSSSSKRNHKGSPYPPHSLPRYDSRISCVLRPLDGGGALLTTHLAGSSHGVVLLRSNKVYTIGRHKKGGCDVGFSGGGHRCISRRHCQVFLDRSRRKLLLVDGFFRPAPSNLGEARRRFRSGHDPIGKRQGLGAMPSLNGIFVNGHRLRRGTVTELSVGDEVSFGCPKCFDHDCRIRYGFVVERVGFWAESVRSDPDDFLAVGTKRICPSLVHMRLGHGGVIRRALSLWTQCKSIRESTDPVMYIRESLRFTYVDRVFELDMSAECNALSVAQDMGSKELYGVVNATGLKGFQPCTSSCDQSLCRTFTKNTAENFGSKVTTACSPTILVNKGNENVCHLHPDKDADFITSSRDQSLCRIFTKTTTENFGSKDTTVYSPTIMDNKGNENVCHLHPRKDADFILPSDGKLLFLNRLDFMDDDSLDHHCMVSLSELFHPVGSLQRIFIATFTSDISWFLSCCHLPNQLPITIACHNTEKCWSASADKRTFMPYPDYPNLFLVYPPFPEVIAFGGDRKKRGVGCHHPKLIVLQREDTIRVVVTSANLVSRQWNSITNTVWWQDFPRRNTPDYLALFTPLSSNKAQDSINDFGAQLAGFVSSLVVDIPEQAFWVTELAKYDFGSAVGHLIASIPGIHTQDSSYFAETEHWLAAKDIVYSEFSGRKLLGSVQTFVAGISHLFRTANDSNGIQLKTLASFLGVCRQNARGMTEVILKRNANIPADVNAVSILVTDSDQSSDGDYVQLGFLPRDVAKWVSPLSDAGFFSFSGSIFPKEAIAAALGGSSTRVQLILCVSQGPNFSEISCLIQPEHFAPLCSLLASMQRCLGLWRLQEVLGPYRWPESLETDFVYGSSSIGTSVNPQFLAAFASAAGKRSSEFSESEESDPEWGRWTINHELRNPSMRIIFPTIERVKNGTCGVMSCRYLLSLSEKTWQRLSHSKIFHDAIPHPGDRVGYPMHVKVARRRFRSKTDSSSFGWIYCGSHNFSPAAWGHLIQYSSEASKSLSVVNSSFGPRLRICNYELGILFIVPPPGTFRNSDGLKSNLDATVLPFVLPAPKYQCSDRPATTQAMREVALLDRESSLASAALAEIMDADIPDEEEEMVEVTDFIPVEKEEEKIYAEMLWSQVDSSEG